MNNLEKHHFLNSLINTYKLNFKSERGIISKHQDQLANTIRELSKEVQKNFEDTKYFRSGLTALKVKSKMNK
jgi:hypothetical protein